MARLLTRINVQNKQTENLDDLARATGLSRSEHVNRALTDAIENFPTLISTLLTLEPAEDKGKPASYTVEAELLKKQQEICHKLHISKDLFFRLSIDYYSYRHRPLLK